MQLAATMIDAGQIDYALVVDGEGARYTQEVTIDRLAGPDATARGRARAVRHPDPRARARRRWCSAAPTSTRRATGFVGGVARAGTEHHELCVGDLDCMRTDTKGLLDAGLALVGRDAGTDARAEFDWADMDRYVIHQVSQVHTRALCRGAGHRPEPGAADASRLRGNIGPAAVPFTLATQADSLHPGDRVLLHGHRLGPEHLLRRDRLVSSRTDRAGRAARPARAARARPALVAAASTRTTPTAYGAPGTCSTTARSRCTARCCACTATRPGRTCGAGSSPQAPAGLAGGRGRPARDGLLRAHRRRGTLAAAGRRPGRADRRARRHRPGRDRRPRLGRRRSRSAGRCATATSCAASC